MFKKHKNVEKNSILMLILIVITISIGGLIEIVPLFRLETTIERIKGVRPYTPLELIGRNVYISEGCYNCHSQQIRPLRDEVERYGHYSLAAESMYDHPFQWGSKRTGPDLARVGGKYSNEWHVMHLIEPQSVVPSSIMPSYRHLFYRGAKLNNISDHLKTLKLVGVPYTEDMIKNSYNDAMAQARKESTHHDGIIRRYDNKVNFNDFDGQKEFVSEMDALISYLQVLGVMVDFKDYDIQLLNN